MFESPERPLLGLVTTIGYERAHNKALQITDDEEFVQFALNTAPPEPTYDNRMKYDVETPSEDKKASDTDR